MQVRNSVTLIGNLGAAPESKTFDNGTVLTEFSLATNDTYKDRDGNKVTRTEWHRVKAFGKVAEVLEQYLHTGSQIAVSGCIRYNKWVDKFDQNRTTAEIILESFTFLDTKTEGNRREREDRVAVAAEPATKKASNRRDQTSNKKKRAVAAGSDDLPF